MASWIDIFLRIPYLEEVAKIAVIVIVAVVLERLATKYLRRFFERLDWPPGLERDLYRLSRFLVILGALIFLLTYGVPQEWSAIIFDAFQRSALLKQVAYIGTIAAVAVVLERLVKRYMRMTCARVGMPPNVENGLVMISRFFIILGAVAMLVRTGGFPTEWFTAFSALGGAAIGFASTRTIGNLIAGLYLLVSRPFQVQDYIRVGGVEGVVKEMTLNYTKILTPGMTTVSLSNQKILDQDIVNYKYSGMGLPILEGKGEGSILYCYNFEMSFDHVLSTDKLEGAFERVIEKYAEKLPRKPEYGMIRLARLDRTYMFYLYVESPTDIFTLQPTFMKEVTEEWEKTVKSEQ